MPAFVFNADTEKESTLKELHTDWNDLKKMHAVVITKAKLSFNKNLGKVLDNRVTLWKAVHDAKDALDPANLDQLKKYRAKLVALKTNAKNGQPIIKVYYVLVRKLNVTASKHAYTPMEQHLLRIERALKYDIAYAENM